MSKLTEIKKVERLYSIYDSAIDKVNDTKYIKVYEIITFKIKQKNGYIKKRYYNLLYATNYKFISYDDDINRYKQLYNYYKKISPFMIEINISKSDSIDMLKEYYNNHSYKYFKMIIENNVYNDKKSKLLDIRNNIELVDLDSYINIICFDI